MLNDSSRGRIDLTDLKTTFGFKGLALAESDPGFAERLGVLSATGLIVGDSLFNVVYAGLVAGSDNPDVLAITEEAGWATPVGIVLFVGALVWLYAWTRRRAAEPLNA